MKLYDAECPVCGMLNRRLYLEETGGWMECEHCGTMTRCTDHPEKVWENHGMYRTYTVRLNNTAERSVRS